jgi:hypothetical protein
MSIGRVLISWMAASLWFAGGLLLLGGGYFLPPFLLAGLGSLAIALFVATLPLKPVGLVAAGVAVVFSLLAVLLAMIWPTDLAIAATFVYAAAAFFSFGAYRYEPR